MTLPLPPGEGRGEGVTIRTALAEAAATLSDLDSPRYEARLLLAAATGLDPAALLRDPAAAIDLAHFRALVARRAAREPLAFILGHQDFWSLRFAVSPATLIPRADSETVVEAALAAHPDPRRILDLGTGTGCLLLATLSERPAAWGLGLDRDPAAAALAAANARALGLSDRAAFAATDWAAPIRGQFDLVLSNPPYIPSADIPALMPEVARHEPGRALDGGPDGLDAYRALLAALPALLAPGGAAVFELGIGQHQAVAALAGAAGFAAGEGRADLAGIPRAITLVWPPTKR